MLSSASDLMRWAQALRNGELLDPQMQKEFLTYTPPQEPRSTGEEYLQGIQKFTEFYPDDIVYGHGGGTLGFTTGWNKPMSLSCC